MPVTVTQRPLAEVGAGLSAKTPIGSKLGSAKWQRDVPQKLRDEAFFSAKVESVKALAEAQRGLQQVLDMVRGSKGEVAMDRSKWIAEMQKTANRLGLRNTNPDKRGGLEDFGSERRLKLIYEQQISSAQNQAYYESGMDADVLDGWPAQELVRVRNSKIPRDWTRRWQAAGGKFYGSGRMIALKTDPIWTKISRFGRPFPPFDYNSGMGVEEIDREQAEALGLLKPGEPVPTELDGQPSPSTPKGRAQELERSVAGLGDDMKKALKETFGDQIELDGDTARWKGGAEEVSQPKAKRTPSIERPAPGRGIAEEPRRATREEVASINADKEMGTIYDAAGKVAFQKRGEAFKIKFTRAEVKLLDDATLAHNHPGGTAHSAMDLVFAVEHNLREMRVVTATRDGQARLYRVSRPEGGWTVSPAQIAAAYDAAEKVARKWLAGERKAGRISRQQERDRLAETTLEVLRDSSGGAMVYEAITL